MKKRGAASIIYLLSLLAGCQSAYRGEKLDAEGDLRGARDAGIPYVMTTPEYTVTRDDSAKPPRYTVNVANVPDPSQRYTLRLSPALTSAVTFDMNLGPEGQLTSVSNKLTDQIVPTVKALFSFALSTAGTVAKIAGTTFAVAAQLRTESNYVDCLDEKTDARRSYCAIDVAMKTETCSDAAGEQLKERIRIELFDPQDKPKQKPKDKVKPDRGDIFATLHYLDPGERACLLTTARGIEDAAGENGLAKTLEDRFKNLLKDDPALPPNDTNARRAFKARLSSIIEQSDATGGRRLVEAVKLAVESRADDRLALVQRELGDAKLNPSMKELLHWRDSLKQMNMWGDVIDILNAELPDKYNNTERKRFKAEIKKIIEQQDGRDAQALNALLKRRIGVAQGAKGTQDSEKEELERQLQAVDDMGIATLPPDKWKRLPAEPIEALARAKRVSTGLRAIAELGLDKWRGRHIAYLDKLIQDRALADMTSGPFTQPVESVSAGDPFEDDKVIRAWRRKIAITAGKNTEYDRLRAMEAVLDKIPPTSSDRISPFEEYGRARAEAERLKTEIAQAAETLVAGAKAAPAAASPLPLSAPRVPASCVEESIKRKSAWYYGEGATAPEFVIVLERPSGSPTSTKACRWSELW